MCEPRNGSGRWRKREPGRSDRKMRKREPRHSAWGRMSNWVCRGSIRTSEMTPSGARHCSGRRRKRIPGQSGGIMRERESWHNAWERMSKWVRQGSVCASEITSSGARRCSGRGRACRGRHATIGEWGRSRHRGTGKLICSGGDSIWLGALARSLACSICLITEFTDALALNSADALRARVSPSGGAFPLWGFAAASHYSGRFIPEIRPWVKNSPFG